MHGPTILSRVWQAALVLLAAAVVARLVWELLQPLLPSLLLLVIAVGLFSWFRRPRW